VKGQNQLAIGIALCRRIQAITSTEGLHRNTHRVTFMFTLSGYTGCWGVCEGRYPSLLYCRPFRAVTIMALKVQINQPKASPMPQIHSNHKLEGWHQNIHTREDFIFCPFQANNGRQMVSRGGLHPSLS
jgi:hypothetical protein